MSTKIKSSSDDELDMFTVGQLNHNSLELMENSPQRQCVPRHMMVPEPRIPGPLGSVLHCDTASGSLEMGNFQSMSNSVVWRNLKREREREEMESRNPRLFRETDLFRDIDLMRNNNSFGREETLRSVDNMCSYDTVSRMELVTCQDSPPFRTHAPGIDSTLALTAPSKKTRFSIPNDDLHLRYSREFWGGNPMETSVNRVTDDLQQVGFRRMTINNSPEIRMRSPPALIPLPQNQPVRPQPLTPFRPPSNFPHSMEWEHVSLPLPYSYLACYSLLQTRSYNSTLPTSPFGLGRVAPFLHPSVP